MKKIQFIIASIISILILILLIACAIKQETKKNELENKQQPVLMEKTAPENTKTTEKETKKEEPTTPETGKDVKTEHESSQATATYLGNLLAGTASRYYEFNKADYDLALKENKIILLYFYANWCPICKVEEPKTFAAFSELNNDKVIGFRVNYRDNEVDEFEEDLARKFGVSYQHTKIILKDGERALKAPDS